MSEMRIGIRELKARLSDYLRQVRRGQVIVITDHGQAYPTCEGLPPLKNRFQSNPSSLSIVYKSK